MPDTEFPAPQKKHVLIGVLLNNKDIVYSPQKGAIRLKMLVKANSQPNTDIYLFSLKDIDYACTRISGTFYDPDQGRWANKLFSFPDVLYIRNGALNYSRAEFLRFLRATEAHGMRIVNNLPAFNKWEVCQVLSRHAKIKPHLPETRLYRSHGNGLLTALRQMLQLYGSVYLKACRGRRGLQVMRIVQLPNRSYECSYFAHQPIVRRVPGNSLYQMGHIIEQFFGKQSFVAQQPIDLIEIKGSKVDLRAEVQRNGRGELEIVAVPVRVGQPGCPITTHAASFRFEDFFTGYMGYSEAELGALQNRIHELLFSIYEALEDHYGSFGEIGIDLGLDKEGKLWLIECNAQSAKVSLMNAYSEGIVARAFSNPLEYAQFLARAESPQDIPSNPPSAAAY